MSQPLRSAYISIVIAVQAARLAGEQLQRARALVGRRRRSSGLVGGQLVLADLHRVAESVRARCGAAFMVRSIMTSGLNSSPVGTFGVKKVDLGGMFTPAAAISRIWLDRRAAQEEGGVVGARASTSSSASSSLRE